MRKALTIYIALVTLFFSFVFDIVTNAVWNEDNWLWLMWLSSQVEDIKSYEFFRELYNSRTFEKTDCTKFWAQEWFTWLYMAELKDVKGFKMNGELQREFDHIENPKLYLCTSKASLLLEDPEISIKAHELWHSVYYEQLNKSVRNAFRKLHFESNWSFVSAYAETSVEEDFAETFKAVVMQNTEFYLNETFIKFEWKDKDNLKEKIKLVRSVLHYLQDKKSLKK